MATEKETTAPIPSVAPDGEQPSALARTDSIAEFEETYKQFGKMRVMTMPELMETRFRVRPVVIDGLLPAGTYLLAGAPKIGKSFLVLQTLSRKIEFLQIFLKALAVIRYMNFRRLYFSSKTAFQKFPTQ